MKNFVKNMVTEVADYYRNDVRKLVPFCDVNVIMALALSQIGEWLVVTRGDYTISCVSLGMLIVFTIQLFGGEFKRGRED